MCSRYGQTKKGIERFAKLRSFDLKNYDSGFEVTDNYNLSPYNTTYFFSRTNERGVIMQSGLFAYNPYPQSKYKPINLRLEGKQGKEKLNEDNDPNYSGQYLSYESGMFAKGLKERRCLVPVDHFFEGSTVDGLSKPFLIRRKDGNSFSIAGIYNYVDDNFWCGLGTTSPAPLLQQIGHHRSPFVLTREEEKIWLDFTLPVKEVFKIVKPFDSSDYEAFPVTPEMRAPNRKDKPNNSIEYTKPIGETIRV